jgi:hypothetical protein
MVARVQDMQGSRRVSNGADSDGGSWSSSDALTAEMLTMSGPTEEDGPAQKQIHVPDVSAGTKGYTTVMQLHKYRQIDILKMDVLVYEMVSGTYVIGAFYVAQWLTKVVSLLAINCPTYG